MKQVNLNKLRQAWRNEGLTDKYIAELINMDSKNLIKKFNGTIKPDVTATQYAVICEEIGTTMEIFYTEGE